MNDLHKSKIHKTMSHIRDKNTKPEIMLRKALWHRGIRYRTNDCKLMGKPDLVITYCHIAIFVDGDFWHGKDFNTIENRIKTNRRYWIPKIKRNMLRDQQVNETLTEDGWLVLRFWESDIKHHLNDCVKKVLEYIPKSHMKNS